MKRYFVSLMFTFILGAAGYALFDGWASPKTHTATVHSAQSRPVGDASGEDNARLTRELAAVIEQVGVLKGELAMMRRGDSDNRATVGTPVERADQQTLPLDPAEMARQEQEWHSTIAEVEASFRNEVREPNWAAAVTSTVQQAFRADEKVAPRIRAIECRSHTCRIELADDGSEPTSDSLLPILAKLAGELPKAKSDRIDESDGRKTMLLFMSRDSES